MAENAFILLEFRFNQNVNQKKKKKIWSTSRMHTDEILVFILIIIEFNKQIVKGFLLEE